MIRNPTALIVVAFAIVVALLLLPYFVTFRGGLSLDQANWAAFGTYVNGVVTPLTVLAALLALVQSDKARRAETAQIIAQSSKADLLRFIEKIENDIESILGGININVTAGGKTVAHPCRDLLFKLTMLEWEKLIPTSQEILERVDSSKNGLDRYDQQVILYEVFGMVTAHITRLRDHCEAYDKAARNNATSLYFARKYRDATERLNSKGYSIAVWHPAAQPAVPADAAASIRST